MCMNNGYYAVKDEATMLFAGHVDAIGNSSRKIYSPPKPLHAMIGIGPKYDYIRVGEDTVPNPEEPMFLHVSKFGMMDRLSWLRNNPDLCTFEVPADVSEDFKQQMDSWQVEERKKPNTEETIQAWVQRRKDDHMFKCLCYIAVLMEDFGMFGGMIKTDEK